MEIAVKNYVYDVSLNWEPENKTGFIRSGKSLPIIFSPPPEFNGVENAWSPEQLMIASLASCYVTTFFHFVKLLKLQVQKFRLSANVEFEKGEKTFEAVKYILRPAVSFKNNPDHLTVTGLFDKSKKYCFISNSVKGQVIVEPVIE